MNCPSRTESPLDHPEWNQNPPPLTADLTTRQDLNGIANAREQREHGSMSEGSLGGSLPPDSAGNLNQQHGPSAPAGGKGSGIGQPQHELEQEGQLPYRRGGASSPLNTKARGFLARLAQIIKKYVQFIGPGFLIAVAYIDPGNYATDVAAGAETKFALLFIVLMSNLFAIFLQSLCIRLGSVTGLNLAENCKAHLPKWLTIILYIFAESAIIATDIAEVGSHPSLTPLGNSSICASCSHDSLGCGICHRSQPPFENPSCRRLCNHFGRCLGDSILLQTKWDHVWIAGIRVLRDVSGARCCRVLLHPVIPHRRF